MRCRTNCKRRCESATSRDPAPSRAATSARLPEGRACALPRDACPDSAADTAKAGSATSAANSAMMCTAPALHRIGKLLECTAHMLFCGCKAHVSLVSPFVRPGNHRGQEAAREKNASLHALTGHRISHFATRSRERSISAPAATIDIHVIVVATMVIVNRETNTCTVCNRPSQSASHAIEV